MAELLLELLSEEIPARMQARAADDLKRLFVAALKDAELSFDAVDTFATPRRLTLHATGLPARQPDRCEERRGPRIDAPEKAIEGFLKSAGITRDEAEEREEQKGIFLWAVIEEEGRPTGDVLAEVLPKILQDFPWPKSMRWGASSTRWVRPLQGILCLLDDVVVDFEFAGFTSGKSTAGHPFLAPEPFEVTGFADYEKELRKAKVILSAAERRDIIQTEAEKAAKKLNCTVDAPDWLLDEVAGLVEWPVVLTGEFDAHFLDVPHEALTSEMQQHQKYFPLRDAKTGEITNRFICVANIPNKTGAIAQGNERVLSARLADARFFWDQDRKTPLENNLPKLDDIVFHEKLGSVGDRARRLEELAAVVSKYIGETEKNLSARAGLLAKCDLVTGMVGEFPDLQGIMGGYYAAAAGEDAAVAQAIRTQYQPRGPNDDCPTEPVGIALALADKIDALVGLFGIGEKPTGSKDPFALRRAALGAIRLIVENGIRTPLLEVFEAARAGYSAADVGDSSADLLDFFADRLKVQQRERGVRHDLIDAVFAAGHDDDLMRLLNRVQALADFLVTEDGENLLVGYKRAVNIVRIEEKRDNRRYDGKVDPDQFAQPDEKALFAGLNDAQESIETALAAEDFAAAMAAVAALRKPIDRFFDNVTVNVEEGEENRERLRENRLNLLARIRTALMPVADFSKIEG